MEVVSRDSTDSNLLLHSILHCHYALHNRFRKRSGEALVLEQEQQGIGEFENRGTDYEMNFATLPEKDSSSQ